MIVPYRLLPGSSVDRPFLDVLFGNSAHRVSALVDSGAVHGLFHPDIAAEADLDLSSAEERVIQHGPGRAERSALFTTVGMEACGLQWEAEVGFTEGMTLDWGLLGQSALFRWFTMTFFGADSEFDIEPIDR